MRRFFITVVVTSLALGTIALPTAAATHKYHEQGWHILASNQMSASTTLIDRSPGETSVFVAVQKKAGPEKCRTKVSFTRGGLTQSRVFEKYSRTEWRSGVWALSGPDDSTIGVRITTNGRCIVGAGVR
jgi:hypothetical protein